MGHKVHPTGFRLGVIRDWQSKWYTDTQYAEFVYEDVKIREAIRAKYREAGISLMEIDRQAKELTINLYTARPGIVIGRGGQRVDEMRAYLEGLVGKRVRLNIQEVRQPELDAYLVARSVAEQIERRVAYRRAMKQAIFRTIQAGAKGIKISCAGRLGNAEIARRQTSHQGQVPLHTLRADIDYGFTEAHTGLGRIGVKVWIYKGEILPEPKVIEEEAEPVEVEEATVEAAAEATPVAVTEKAPAAVETAPAPAEKPARAVEKKAEKAEKAEPAETAAAEKPAKPAARKAAKAETAEAPAEKPARAVVKKAEKAEAAETEAAEKPAKPAAKKAVKAADETEPPATTEEEANDAAA